MSVTVRVYCTSKSHCEASRKRVYAGASMVDDTDAIDATHTAATTDTGDKSVLQAHGLDATHVLVHSSAERSIGAAQTVKARLGALTKAIAMEIGDVVALGNAWYVYRDKTWLRLHLPSPPSSSAAATAVAGETKSPSSTTASTSALKLTQFAPFAECPHGPHECGACPTLRCSGCKATYYCSNKCRAHDWAARHQLLCPVMKEFQSTTLSVLTERGGAFERFYRTLHDTIAALSEKCRNRFYNEHLWVELHLFVSLRDVERTSLTSAVRKCASNLLGNDDDNGDDECKRSEAKAERASFRKNTWPEDCSVRALPATDEKLRDEVTCATGLDVEVCDQKSTVAPWFRRRVLRAPSGAPASAFALVVSVVHTIDLDALDSDRRLTFPKLLEQHRLNCRFLYLVRSSTLSTPSI